MKCGFSAWALYVGVKDAELSRLDLSDSSVS